MKNTLFLVLALFSIGAFAATAGEVTHLSGTVSVKKPDGSSKLLSINPVQEGDLIVTEAETYARIKFVDGGEVVLRPNTQLKVEPTPSRQASPRATTSC